jgi:NOL1/NOP2/fmu family ribosome biogenesis protein
MSREPGEIKILNKKEIKLILEIARKQWGCELGLDYAWLEKDDGSIFLMNKEFVQLDLQKLRVNSYGLYFGEIKNGSLRLSIEGSQIAGKLATKNVLELSDEEIDKWLHGEELKTDYPSDEFVIIKNGNDFFGTGKVKDGKIVNFIPKGRRLK